MHRWERRNTVPGTSHAYRLFGGFILPLSYMTYMAVGYLPDLRCFAAERALRLRETCRIALRLGAVRDWGGAGRDMYAVWDGLGLMERVFGRVGDGG